MTIFQRIKYGGCAVLISGMSCYPFPPGPNALMAEEQQAEVSWVTQMQDLIFYLEAQLVYLKAHTHSVVYMQEIKILEEETDKLQEALNQYTTLAADKQTQEMRKDMSGKYCELICEVVTLREKIKPPEKSNAKDT